MGGWLERGGQGRKRLREVKMEKLHEDGPGQEEGGERGGGGGGAT